MHLEVKNMTGNCKLNSPIIQEGIAPEFRVLQILNRTSKWADKIGLEL